MGLRAGTLFVVATPIGNLEDITARALRILREAAVIAAEDTRRTAQILARYAIRTPLTSLHEHNEAVKTASLLDRLRAGDHIALVSDAGTPTVSDPGSTLIRAAIDADIRVETIPGPSAVIAALAVSGLPTGSFTFLGFPPTKAKDRRSWFERLKAVGGTVVFFEAPHRIVRTLEGVLAIVGDCRVAVARELTKVHEELVRGPISEVLRSVQAPRGEFTVVVYIGLMPEHSAAAVPSDREMADLFGVMTNTNGLGRRAAVVALAKRHAMTARQVYAVIERAKKLVE